MERPCARMPFVAAVRCVPFRSLNRSGISGPIGKPGSVTGSSQCGERASHDRPPPTERNVLTYKVFRYARADRGCWSVRLAASRRPDGSSPADADQLTLPSWQFADGSGREFRRGGVLRVPGRSRRGLRLRIALSNYLAKRNPLVSAGVGPPGAPTCTSVCRKC